MDFQKKDWQFRDLITENELNRMESGIEEGITKAEQAQQTANEAKQTANEAKDTADAVQSDLSAHTSATTGVHGATSAATPNTIIQRDPSGRAKVAAPAASDDIARKDTVDAVQINLTNHIADYVRQPGYAVATGSANTYAVTLNPAPTAYVDGMAVAVKINVANTGAATLNVNGLGAKALKKPDGSDFASGELRAGAIYTFRYSTTTGNFILQGEGGGGIRFASGSFTPTNGQYTLTGLSFKPEIVFGFFNSLYFFVLNQRMNPKVLICYGTLSIHTSNSFNRYGEITEDGFFIDVLHSNNYSYNWIAWG